MDAVDAVELLAYGVVCFMTGVIAGIGPIPWVVDRWRAIRGFRGR